MQTRSTAVNTRELRSIVGDIDEAKIIEILKLNPSVTDLEEAVIWDGGDGDTLGKQGHPLVRTAAQIFEILTADDDESQAEH